MTVVKRHPDGWTTEQINEISDRIRDWFDENDPDVSRLLFNSDLSEIAMLVWPYAYRAGREGELAVWSER
ncbi:hypothetical protein Ade02nite_21050 [Paractinoplanes deccanensis]|uniref:Uncharacterized protein n=1 Tax=Paractinoplanes deccanensis TaxID=113561 RepID=A0ABQ3Y0D2_9ACTN|nr:hypothetical protein [Actinoplanes deccanensis]GID73464.1 hypothetical protein Ade02nite_21050 [Actinoplanes deccanensis]